MQDFNSVTKNSHLFSHLHKVCSQINIQKNCITDYNQVLLAQSFSHKYAEFLNHGHINFFCYLFNWPANFTGVTPREAGYCKSELRESSKQYILQANSVKALKGKMKCIKILHINYTLHWNSKISKISMLSHCYNYTYSTQLLLVLKLYKM